MPRTYPDLTAEQLGALQAYADQHGRSWKSALLDDWIMSRSRTYRGEWAPLQQVRNLFGPSWLNSFVL